MSTPNNSQTNSHLLTAHVSVVAQASAYVHVGTAYAQTTRLAHSSELYCVTHAGNEDICGLATNSQVCEQFQFALLRTHVRAQA